MAIAVVGAGLIGRRHIGRIGDSPNCTLAAVVDPNETVRHLAADTPYFRTLEALLTAMSPDGVILATPNQLHTEQGVACLQAGIPTLIEKPVADTFQAGLRLLEAQKTSGTSVLIGHHRAHSVYMQRARRFIGEGVLGDLVAVTGSAMFYKPDAYFQKAPWRTQPGGGPVLINMIHEVHNLRMLCGEIEAVQAFASNKVRGFPVEDTVAMTLRFTNGVLGTFLLSDTAATAKSWEQTSREDKSYAAYPENCYLVAGTKGSLELPTLRLKTYAGTPSWQHPFEESQIDVKRADPLTRQLEHFCRLIRGEVEPRVSLQDGLQNLKITEAIIESAATGETVVTS